MGMTLSYLPVTQVIISFDTELSPALYQRGMNAADNFDSSILGLCDEGEFGIRHQMDELERHGLKGVFFIDPMPALVYGEEIIRRIVEPIVLRGHEVQLHIHTEWLEYTNERPVGELQGKSIGEYPYNAQLKLISLARFLLMRAGAPQPTAFRARNFGANDNTLRALSALGFNYDSSFNTAYIDKGCEITLDPTNLGMREYLGVWMIPVSGIMERGNSFRPAQLCAMSEEEMLAALDHAASCSSIHFSAFSHSFELLSRDRAIPNLLITQRLAALCANVADDDRLTNGGFADLPYIQKPRKLPILRPNAWRTGRRQIEQAISMLLYEKKMLPAKLGEWLHRN